MIELKLKKRNYEEDRQVINLQRRRLHITIFPKKDFRMSCVRDGRKASQGWAMRDVVNMLGMSSDEG